MYPGGKAFNPFFFEEEQAPQALSPLHILISKTIFFYKNIMNSTATAAIATIPITALSKILSATCGLNSQHPQFCPPPAGLVSALEIQRQQINADRAAKGQPSFSQITDLSGNVIVIPE